MRRRDIWAAIHEERALLVEVLRHLTPEQFEAPSLCAGWRVRDVVGHLCGLAHQYRRYTLPIFTGVIRNGFRPNRFWDRDARARGAAPPEALVDELARAVGERRHPWPAFPLAETIVHGQDIRLPLGLDRTFPTERLIVVADLLRLPNYPPTRRTPTHGLRLEASDAAWASGRGLVVRGPLKTLVLAMAGRPVMTDALTGDGVPALTAPRPADR